MRNLFLLLLAVVVFNATADVCKDKTKEAKGLYDKCVKMKRGSSEYKACASSYKQLKVQVEKACGAGSASEEDLNTTISKWKKLVDQCRGRKDTRCAEAQWRLGHYTFQLEELQNLKRMDQFDKDVSWCEQRDNKPPKCQNLQLPKSDHEKSLGYFEEYISKYPDHNKTANVMYQASFIYETSGRFDQAYELRKKMVQKFPNNGLTPKAWLRIGEYYFMERRFREAIEAYKKVKGFNLLTGKEAALALYHMAESYYNLADYELAAQTYYDYIYGSDHGKYPADLRPEAMDFMAAAYADMDGGGIEQLAKFLKDKKELPYRDSIYYRVGMKNKDHDRNEEAIIAFKYLLDISPNYIDAPLADLALIEIMLLRQMPAEAQAQRLIVVERYGPGSSWQRANVNNTESVERAKTALRGAMLDIPQYHHASAAKLKQEGDTEGAKAEYAKAIQTYERFLEKYPEPSWDEYKVHINMAIVYQDLAQYKKAANEFNWVSDADTVKYGRKPVEYETLLSKPDAAYNAVLAMDKAREIATESKAGGDAQKAYTLPETKDYFDQVKKYMAGYGNREEAAELAYNSAVVHYDAKSYENAIRELKAVRAQFPKHKYILFISRMLAQASLEANQLDESAKEFEWLLAQYKSGENKNDSMAVEIDRSIAAVMFQKADKAVKSKDYVTGAKAYLALVNRYPVSEFSDKAVFEAAAAYESAQKYVEAAETFMMMPKNYVNSPLTIRAIMRAALSYKKAQKPQEAANTFLFITNNFPKDSAAFDAISFAAYTYDSIPNKQKAAETFEIAYKKYPNHPKTPELLYSACLTYEEATMTDEAIRCNKDLVRDYKSSSYALDAAYSIPEAYRKAKKWDLAAQAYIDFAKGFTTDKEKLLAAHFYAAQSFMELKDETNAAKQYTNTLITYDKWGANAAEGDEVQAKKNAVVEFPAEASYNLGVFERKNMEPVVVKGDQKAKGKAITQLTDILGKSASHFSKAATYASEKWTFKATNELGYLFVRMAAKVREQELSSTKPEEQFVERITTVQMLPGYYEQARPIFEKNISLARDGGFYGDDVKAAEEGYIEMFYQDCATFFEVADAFRAAPLPDRGQMIQEYIEYEGFSKEDAEVEVDMFLEDYKAELEGKAETAEQGGLPRCESGIKASAHWGIDNKWTAKLKEAIKKINPENEVATLSIEKYDPASAYKDMVYFNVKSRIEQVATNEQMTLDEKASTLQSIIEDARTQRSALERELSELKARLAPPDSLNATGAGVQ
jgi:tetratricopeptide (TPR) repeat protein